MTSHRGCAAAVLFLIACGSSGGGGGPGPGDSGVPDAGPPVTPVAPGWEALHQIPAGWGEAAIAASDNKVYLFGGYDTEKTVEIYDIPSNTWTFGATLPHGTDNAGAVVYQGKIYVFGGEASPLVQVYTISTGSWAAGPALPSPRFSSVVELVGSEVHLIGGWSFDRSNNVSLAIHTVFDLVSGTYLAGPYASLTTARNHAYSGVIGGKIYVTGGRAPGHEGNDGTNVVTTEVFDPANDSWAPLPDLPTPRSGGASAVLGGKLYVLGGGLPGNTVYKTVSRFDPATGAWETLGNMPIELTGHRAVAVGTSIYVVGGFVTRNGLRQGFSGVPYVWRYTPQ